jgi:hypothetical protein
MDGTDIPKVFCVGIPHAPATRDEIHRADQPKHSFCMYMSMVEDLGVCVFCLTVSNAQLQGELLTSKRDRGRGWTDTVRSSMNK